MTLRWSHLPDATIRRRAPRPRETGGAWVCRACGHLATSWAGAVRHLDDEHDGSGSLRFVTDQEGVISGGSES